DAARGEQGTDRGIVRALERPAADGRGGRRMARAERGRGEQRLRAPEVVLDVGWSERHARDRAPKSLAVARRSVEREERIARRVRREPRGVRGKQLLGDVGLRLLAS